MKIQDIRTDDALTQMAVEFLDRLDRAQVFTDHMQAAADRKAAEMVRRFPPEEEPCRVR